VHTELGHEIAQMGAHGVGGQVQPFRHVAASRAVGETGQDLAFARRQRGEERVLFLLLVLRAHQDPHYSACFGRRQPRLPAHGAAGHPQEMVERFVLAHPRRGPDSQRRHDTSRLRVITQHDYARRRNQASQGLAQGTGSVPGQIRVQQHDVGPSCVLQIFSTTRAAGRHHRHILLGVELGRYGLGEDLFGIDDEDGNSHIRKPHLPRPWLKSPACGVGLR
jgi:hypothetical protein